jgi:hypothetical protein
MEHIEEHILELYVLGSAKVEQKREEIARHLRQCPGCQALATEMEEFYREAAAEVADITKTQPSDQRAIAHFEKSGLPVRREPTWGVRRGSPVKQEGPLRRFVRRHPVVSVASTFSMGAAMVAGVVFALSTTQYDVNPAIAYYKTDQDLVEIRNKENKNLWEIASYGLLDQTKRAAERNSFPTVLADLNGDGRNEILTVLTGSGLRSPVEMRVFDYRGNILYKEGFRRAFQYLERTYSQGFDAIGVVVRRFADGRHPEIFVLSCHEMHSPCFVTRFDNQGNILGEFWHFGQFWGMYLADVEHSGTARLVLVGLNDTPDTVGAPMGMRFPVALVIDPEKIVGTTKSVLSPGYHMTRSDAELYYVRFPNSDIDSAMGEVSAVKNLSSDPSTRNEFFVESNSVDVTLRAGFDYSFDSTMQICEVRRNDPAVVAREMLRKAGKVNGPLDQAYLENLKKGVRYWDGNAWREDAVRVGVGRERRVSSK